MDISVGPLTCGFWMLYSGVYQQLHTLKANLSIKTGSSVNVTHPFSERLMICLVVKCFAGPSCGLCRGWQEREIICWYRDPSSGKLQAQTGRMRDLFESLPDLKLAQY